MGREDRSVEQSPPSLINSGVIIKSMQKPSPLSVLPDCYLEGCLEKRSRGTRFVGFNWQKRWIRLDEDGIKYFNSSGDLRGVVLFNAIAAIEETSKYRKHCFVVRTSTHDHNEWYFAAKNVADKTRWLEALQQCLSSARNPSAREQSFSKSSLSSSSRQSVASSRFNTVMDSSQSTPPLPMKERNSSYRRPQFWNQIERDMSLRLRRSPPPGYPVKEEYGAVPEIDGETDMTHYTLQAGLTPVPTASSRTLFNSDDTIENPDVYSNTELRRASSTGRSISRRSSRRVSALSRVPSSRRRQAAGRSARFLKRTESSSRTMRS